MEPSGASDACLIMMVKDPARARVKGRLAEQLGISLATKLYRCFVDDLLRTIRMRSYEFRVAFHPAGSYESVKNWLGPDITLIEQTGNNLGARMRNAFLTVFREGFSRVVLVGSDIPGLTGGLILDAFLALKERGAAVGPALDGGYYMIGFQKDRFAPEAFDGITWSTETVYRETMGILLRKGLTVGVLPARRDMDTLEDLRAFYREHTDRAPCFSATMTCITDNKEAIL